MVILHGWGDAAASWDGLAKTLAAHWYVVVPDLPGFGASEAPKGVWGLDEYAQFVADLTTKINLHPTAIIGHSNGGAIAIRGLATGKLSADKLVLLASAGIRSTGQGKKSALRLLTKTGKIITMPLPSSVKKRLRSKLYTSVGSDMLFAEHLQETFKKVVGQDVQADAAQISVPSLLMYGEQDTATPVTYGEQYHQLISGSSLVIVPGAAHFIQLDAPSVVAKTIEEFLL